MSQIDIPRLEMATADMLPAEESHIDEGWLFRFTAGQSRNTNAVWPLTAPPDALESRIDACQRIYAERGLPCNFRLTDLDENKVIESYLTERGYETVNPNIIMVRDITDPTDDSVTEIDLDGWADLVRRIDPDSDPIAAEAKHASLSRVTLPTWYATILSDGRETSSGRAVQQDDLYQLAELFTVEDLRGHGLGTQLIRGLLNVGHEAGAQTAFLLVSQSNSGARRLYERLGFRNAYHLRYLVPS